MNLEGYVYPEIWLSLIATLVFFPMMYVLKENPQFDLWRFTILYVAIIVVIYGYAVNDVKKKFKP